MALFKKIENLYQRRIRRIRSDNGTEFKNHKMEEFCEERGILHEFSAPYTPQQNGVAERKNQTLIETARTMLTDSKLPINFWAEAVSAACYTLNRVLTVKKFKKTCFELINNRKPNLKYLEPFGSPCTVIEPFGKFGPKCIEGIFVGYASPLRHVSVPSEKRIIEAANVECQGNTMPPQNPGDSWRYHYDMLWDSFDVMEEPEDEEDFFDDLDILRDYESSEERFLAQYLGNLRKLQMMMKPVLVMLVNKMILNKLKRIRRQQMMTQHLILVQLLIMGILNLRGSKSRF
ncbi:putative RNA-directed DNA polymerase [Helianthus annuus]|nr:putative RNA-directed DNA polymerase [Helianthus annuus]